MMKNPPVSPSSARARLLQRLIAAALVAVCLGPFLANTSVDEKSRMAIKAVAIAAAVGCIALNRARFTLKPSARVIVAGMGVILLGYAFTLADTFTDLPEPGLDFILGALGVSLMACGFTFSQLHARCLGLFALAAVPAAQVENLIEHGLRFSTLVAQISAFTLHYVGFSVKASGNTILIHGHAIEIIAECSGLKLFFLLFAFFIILLLVLPDLRKIFWRMLFAALGTGIVVSILRIDFLALIVGYPELFEFFHHGLGSELISMAAILIFGFFIKEEAFTALEKHFPVAEMPPSHLPPPEAAKPLMTVLSAAIVLGLAVAAVVAITGTA